MKTLASLNEKIVQRERIDLARQSGTSIAFVVFLLFASIGTVTTCLIAGSQGFSPLFFAAAAFFLTGLAFVLSLIWRIIGSAYIKGEMLIARYLFGKSKVTELRAIRCVKTVKIFGMRFTSIRFRIDGHMHKVVIFGGTDYIQDPKTIIDTVRKVA